MVTKSKTSPPPKQPPPPPAAPPSSGGACAACRYQRRKCTDDCPLAPYFPSHQHQHFVNCHRFFGVHNIVKVLRSIPSHQRAAAATSLVHSADARARDPVGGLPRVVWDLQSKIDHAAAHLHFLRGLLDRTKAQAQAQAQTRAQYGSLPMTWGVFDDDDDDVEMDVKPFISDLCGSHSEGQLTHSEPIDLRLRRRKTYETNNKLTKQEDADNSSLE